MVAMHFYAYRATDKIDITFRTALREHELYASSKELAKQTNAATEDIRLKMTAMHDSMAGTVNEIAQVSTVMHSVKDVIATIATAVEAQTRFRR